MSVKEVVNNILIYGGIATIAVGVSIFIGGKLYNWKKTKPSKMSEINSDEKIIPGVNCLPQEVEKDWFDTSLSNNKVGEDPHELNVDKPENISEISSSRHDISTHDIDLTKIPKIVGSPWLDSTQVINEEQIVNEESVQPTKPETDLPKENEVIESLPDVLKETINGVETIHPVGILSVSSSLGDGSHDLKGDPPNPKILVSPWLNSTVVMAEENVNSTKDSTLDLGSDIELPEIQSKN